MKEEDAKKKWCPMVRFTFESEDSPANRWLSNGDLLANSTKCRCITSECMMWRHGGDNCGHCGLAGRE